ncbi:hypothetical protein [Methylicorpusculum sp.]|uniref:hypothetical protein n=1 Tax=Methylicorpusculum sp. TaxID=2713644 RepID=UPI00272F1655|nr:hypothetical protein [Methylicorpusculum sp.]MDP2176984.1 hypothetical protein [Methylicorpusculum sp.]MDP3527801.1 hypothetical protein [Methylicorpusculum sp.]
MGLAQILREEGRQEGEAQMLLKQIQLKFGGYAVWVEGKIDQADKAQLDHWVERILFVDALEQLFKA